MPVERGAFHVFVTSVLIISETPNPLFIDSYWTIRFSLSELNKNEKGRSAPVSAGDKASNASPVLFLNSSREKLYPAGNGGMICTIRSGIFKNLGSMQSMIADKAFSCSSFDKDLVIICPSPRKE